MDGIAERVEDGADLVVDLVGQRHDVEGRDAHILGEGAGDVDADAAGLRVEVEVAGAGGAAPHADDVALARDPLPDLEVADVGADGGDLAGIFVADDHRHRHGAARPLVPVIDVEVGAADAGAADLDQHVVLADLGHRLVAEPQPRLGLELDQGFHRVPHVITPSALPASMKASAAVSMSAGVSAADIWVRMRALPIGTTGKKKPAT